MKSCFDEKASYEKALHLCLLVSDLDLEVRLFI